MPTSAALLQRKQLLRAEGLVVDLACRLNQILEMCPCKEVPEVDEFTVVFVLHVDHSPAVLASADLLAIDDDGFFASDDGEGNDILSTVSSELKLYQ